MPGDLNPVQREAVLHGDGALLVLAGAGSGKTRVLTRRIVHLILDRSIPPERILAVTFTNKAAGEMRSRVESMLGFDAAGLWIGTFHSICLRLLRRHGDRLGFRDGITVFDTDDQASLLRRLLKEQGGQDPELPRLRELASLISFAKNRMWEPEQMEAEWPHPRSAKVAALYRAYQEALRAQGGADFDDLLLLAVRLLESHEDLGDTYAQKFRHILVDEYQDTNPIQFRLVRRLAGVHGNVMVVGDDDQSIYGWRGADITNILEFEKHFPDATVLKMTQNYRSSGQILELANAVIRNNEGRHEKSLWTENPSGDRPVLIIAPDEDEEAGRLVSAIMQGRKDGRFRPGETAILYRVHAQSRPIEEACLTFGLPYVVLGGIAFYQRREVKDLIAYLRLAMNPRDLPSLARALSAPRRGIGQVSVERIVQLASAHGGDAVQACASAAAEGRVRGKAAKRLKEFASLIGQLREQIADGPDALLQIAVEETGYMDWLKEADSDWEDRQANVHELIAGALRFRNQASDPTVQAYLDQVALYTELDNASLEEERVVMMTVHNAKGLEFPHVFIAGLEEGLFPHASSFDDHAELEEERRLFYVAVTRAQQTLTLSAAFDRRRAYRGGGFGLSRFLDEIPGGMLIPAAGQARRPAAGRRPWGAADADDFDEVDDAPDTSEGDESATGAGDNPAAGARGGDAGRVCAATAANAPRAGEMVAHRIFGVGRVESQEGEGSSLKLSVVFEQVGRKKIMARFLQRFGRG